MRMGCNGKFGLRLTKADYRRQVEWHGSEARLPIIIKRGLQIVEVNPQIPEQEFAEMAWQDCL